MVKASVKTATALMEEALEILDSCEVLVPAVHLWTALQALGAFTANTQPSISHASQAVTASDRHNHA
jgi:hypothetical protein